VKTCWREYKLKASLTHDRRLFSEEVDAIFAECEELENRLNMAIENLESYKNESSDPRFQLDVDGLLHELTKEME
jgi:hypothetical protein